MTSLSQEEEIEIGLSVQERQVLREMGMHMWSFLTY